MGPIAIVIPAINEAATIRDVVSSALLAADHVIVVDDSSTDGTADRIADLDIHLIRHAHNRRKAASLWAGMHAALAGFLASDAASYPTGQVIGVNGGVA